MTANLEAGDVDATLELADAPNPAPTQVLSSEEGEFQCLYRGCANVASRQTDLDHHYETVHLSDKQKKRFLCDYKRCPRYTMPFFRQDHFRDHLREYHQEDLLRRGSKGDEEWWSCRNPHVMINAWWRCSRCLSRVGVDKHGFICPKCKFLCEKERQQHRMTMTAST